MQFIYDESCGNEQLSVEADIYKYLFKARRHKVEDEISFRNLKDANLYTYKVSAISKKEALLSLEKQEEKRVEHCDKLHIIWSVVDPKTIEKQLPYLNEIGVDKLSFYYADYSQKNFKLNFDKFEKILINSSQQCGRSSIIQLEQLDSLAEVLKYNNDVYALNFSSNTIDEKISTIVIGCEGGFSPNELKLFNEEKIVGLNSNLILRSETAITAVASKILL